MTTSVLLTSTPHTLNDNDLQTLRDYALEAPWEWRMAFEQLLELAELGFEVEDHIAQIENYEEAFDDAKKTIEQATTDVRRFVEQIEDKAHSNRLTKGDVDDLCSSIREQLNILTGAITKKES